MLIGAALSGTGNAAANRITGNELANARSGLGADDTLRGGAGNDTLDGAVGTDRLVGGAGDDIYLLDRAADVVVEFSGAGRDFVQVAEGYVLPSHVERLRLTGSGDVSGIGNVLDNQLTGNRGNNRVSGLAGNDTLDGGAGMDTLNGGVGNDVFVFAAGEAHGDRVVGFAGNGALAGDELFFRGYGSAATFVQLNATTWEIRSSGGNEALTFAAGTMIDASDYKFG